MSQDDLRYMRRALEIAALARGSTSPNPMVGCVLVRDGQIIGEGFHQKAGEPHAEIDALRKTPDAKGADVYVNLEPCNHFGRTGPCSVALVEAKVRRVVIAMIDPNPKVRGSGIKTLQDAGIEVEVGLLEDEAKRLNEAFTHYITYKTPFSVLKVAQTLDGKIADSQGRSQWITGPSARQRVHQLRAESDAILTGVGTVLADNPSLTVREASRRQGPKGPLRVIVDSQLKTPLGAKLLHDDGPKVIIATTKAQIPEEWRRDNLEVWSLPSVGGRVDLRALYERLGQREISQVMVEAGGLLNGALVEAGLVNKLILFLAPTLLNAAGARSSFSGTDRALSDAFSLGELEVEHIGNDLMVSGYLRPRG